MPGLRTWQAWGPCGGDTGSSAAHRGELAELPKVPGPAGDADLEEAPTPRSRVWEDPAFSVATLVAVPRAVAGPGVLAVPTLVAVPRPVASSRSCQKCRDRPAMRSSRSTEAEVEDLAGPGVLAVVALVAVPPLWRAHGAGKMPGPAGNAELKEHRGRGRGPGRKSCPVDGKLNRVPWTGN
jgi:hypothetical protein